MRQKPSKRLCGWLSCELKRKAYATRSRSQPNSVKHVPRFGRIVQSIPDVAAISELGCGHRPIRSVEFSPIRPTPAHIGPHRHKQWESAQIHRNRAE